MPALILFIAIILVSCVGGCTTAQPTTVSKEKLALEFHKIAVLTKYGEHESAALIQKRVNIQIARLR